MSNTKKPILSPHLVLALCLILLSPHPINAKTQYDIKVTSVSKIKTSKVPAFVDSESHNVVQIKLKIQGNPTINTNDVRSIAYNCSNLESEWVMLRLNPDEKGLGYYTVYIDENLSRRTVRRQGRPTKDNWKISELQKNGFCIALINFGITEKPLRDMISSNSVIVTKFLGAFM